MDELSSQGVCCGEDHEARRATIYSKSHTYAALSLPFLNTLLMAFIISGMLKVEVCFLGQLFATYPLSP